MTPVAKVLSVLCLLSPLVILSTASPLKDMQLENVIKQDPAMQVLPLARRAAVGRQPRHLRPEEYIRNVKRDGSDLGGIATFNGDPQPTRGALGDTFLSASNHEIDKQNIDNLAIPPTDAGVVPNLKWSMSLSHTRLLNGGWVREQTITDLPTSKDLAAAELRLSPNASRELHWHRIAEWGYVLGGTGRLTAVDEFGRTYIADLHGPSNTTDPTIHYFPPGVAHSIQAFDDGLELLLVFTDGNFDQTGTTFMLSDWLARTPLEVVAKNLGVNTSILGGIPQKDPYIYKSTVPPPVNIADEVVKGPAGEVPSPYVFDITTQDKVVAPGGGGWVKIQDSVTNFAISTELASALVYVEPNGMRELHWHNADEWLYIISGHGRATAFAGSSSSRTFDFQEGDTAVFPISYGHYMMNLSPTEPLVFLELFKAPRFYDFSVTQLLALTPPQIVADLLNISTETVMHLKKEKQIIMA